MVNDGEGYCGHPGHNNLDKHNKVIRAVYGDKYTCSIETVTTQHDEHSKELTSIFSRTEIVY